MANKRNTKRNIHYACGEIAAECIFAQETFAQDNIQKWDDIIIRLALLQQDAIKRISVDFDKLPKDFENRRLYNKSRRSYFKAMNNALKDFMHNEMEKIIADMNALVPKAKKAE